jgi:hypothetical protein
MIQWEEGTTSNKEANEARNAMLAIVTAARLGNTDYAAKLTDEYRLAQGDILPLFISAVSMIETVILTVAKELNLDADKLWRGICLGLTVKQMLGGDSPPQNPPS